MIQIKRISDLRIDNDLTQDQMAKILNITRSKYSKIEVGILDIDLITLNNFAKYFNISIDYIFELTNKKIPYKNDNIDPKQIGKNLKKYRKSIKLSQEQFSSQVGMKQSSYARYEQGKGITGYKLYQIAKSYNLSMDELIKKD